MGTVFPLLARALAEGLHGLAYIDPGTGALVLQFLAAVALGAVYYFRKFIYKLKKWIPGIDAGEFDSGDSS